MKALNTKLSLTLLIMAGLFGPGGQALADAGAAKVQAAFHYNASASPERIYANLERTARFACVNKGVRSLTIKKREKACLAEMLANGVAMLNRADIVELHTGRLAAIASR